MPFREGRRAFATPASPAIILRLRPPTPISFVSAAVADAPSGVNPPLVDHPLTSSMTQHVYFFGGGKAEGTKDMKAVLGGKGANLAEMTNLGVPVPPGFTIDCSVCIDFLRTKQTPASLRDEVGVALRRLEEVTGKRFGDAENPLLVSVRSGAPVSM